MKTQTGNMFRYRGTSMWPCFQDGDLLEIVSLADEKAIRRGDCVLWRDAQGRHVAHRIVSTRGGLQTRGDALSHNDLTGPTRKILGRVVRRHRFGRSSAVAGGIQGRLAGIFYRYAGRIDPERDARGGRLARSIQRLISPLLRPWLTQGYRQDSKGEKLLSECKLGETTLAIRNQATGDWQVPWPWRLFVEVPIDRNPAISARYQHGR